MAFKQEIIEVAELYNFLTRKVSKLVTNARDEEYDRLLHKFSGI